MGKEGAFPLTLRNKPAGFSSPSFPFFRAFEAKSLGRDMQNSKFDKTVGWSARIVSAYISRNSVAATELPTLIGSVQASLRALNNAQPPHAPIEPLKPAVPIRKSVSKDFITCLEDGRRFKSLKRHLRVHYNMTPEQYRIRWQLPPDYPMVAPGYAETRSQMAKSMGLGQQRRPRAGG